MAKATKASSYDGLLSEYALIVRDQKERLDKVYQKAVMLRYKRNGLVLRRTMQVDERDRWNREAHKWRQERQEAIDTAQRLHKPAYEKLLEVCSNFNIIEVRRFHTLNGHYVHAENKLRHTSLPDL